MHILFLHRSSKDQVTLRRTHTTEFNSVEADHGIQDSRGFSPPGPIWTVCNMCHNALSANLNAGRAALIIRIKMYIYVAAVKLRRCDKIWFSFSLPGFGCWCTRRSKSQFLDIGWISVWVFVWRVPRPGKFWQLDMCSPGACFHNFGRNRFCRKVLCSSENYSCLQSYTCLLLIHQVRVSGMLSLAGSVPGPCEQRTYTRKQSPNILIQRRCERAKGQHLGDKEHVFLLPAVVSEKHC